MLEEKKGKRKKKEEKEIGRQEREGRKEREDQKENGQIQDTRGKIPGTVPTGTAKRMVSRLIRGR